MRAVAALLALSACAAPPTDVPVDTDVRDTADTDAASACANAPKAFEVTTRTNWADFGVATQVARADTAVLSVHDCFIDIVIDERGPTGWSLHRTTRLSERLIKTGDGLQPEGFTRLRDALWVDGSLVVRAQGPEGPALARLDPTSERFTALSGLDLPVRGVVPVGGRLAVHADHGLAYLNRPDVIGDTTLSPSTPVDLGDDSGPRLHRFGRNLHTGTHELDAACLDAAVGDGTACVLPAEAVDLVTGAALITADTDRVWLRTPGGRPRFAADLRSLVGVQQATSLGSDLVVLAWYNFSGAVTLSTLTGLQGTPVVTDLAVVPEPPGGDGGWRIDDLWTDGRTVLALATYTANDRVYLWGTRLP